MKIEVKNESSCKKELRIEEEAESLKQEYDAVSQKYQRQASVPGFRRGKTPLAVVLQRYKKEIQEDFLDAAVRRCLTEALQTEKLDPLEPPHIHDLHYQQGESLKFTAAFEVMPKIEVAQYKGLEIEKTTAEVKDEEVESTLKNYQERMAQYVPVTDRSVQNGDFAVISYTGRFQDPARASLHEDESYCEVGASGTLPEFTENLMGASVGETKSIRVKYPDDFPNKQLAAQEVDYSIEVKGIKIKQVPELSDEFAKDAGEFKSLEEMREKVKAEILQHKEEAARLDMQEKVLDLIISRNSFEVPESLVKRQLENRLNDYVRSLLRRGVHPQAMNIDWNDLREQQKEQALRDVKAALVIEHVAGLENIAISDEEVDEDIAVHARNARQSVDAVKSRLTKEGAIDRIKDRIRNRKTLDLLLNSTIIKDPQGSIVQP
ncbi:MAG: trigger factor [Terriglobia bacterium]